MLPRHHLLITMRGGHFQASEDTLNLEWTMNSPLTCHK
jgi:hypothetical protein